MRSPPSLQEELQEQIGDGDDQRLRRSADRWAGDRRRLQDRRRGPRRHRAADHLQDVADKIVAEAATQRPAWRLFTSFRANTPWLYLDIDRTEAKTMGVSMGEVFNTLQVYLGSLYVNDFNRFGRTWQVNVQGRRRFPQADRRHQAAQNPQRPRRHGAAGQHGRRSSDISGPVMIMRYNMYPAAADQRRRRRRASARARRSKQMRGRRRKDLPRRCATEWTELALLQLQTGNTAMFVFVLAVVLGVSGAGGAVRKLVAAAGGDSRRADVLAVLGRRA